MRNDAQQLEISTPDDVDIWAERLFGTAAMNRTGLLHVTSVWRQAPDKNRTLLIRPGVPACSADAFSLNLARARADAILTTGRILRQEPELTHRLQGPGDQPAALKEWRQQRLAKPASPITLVLSSGDVDLDHPIFAGPGRAIVFTGREGQWQLESQAMDRGIEVIAADTPSPAGAIDLLRGQFGAATISIEAGPSVANRFYQPLQVDELLLSTFCQADLDPQYVGPLQTRPSKLAGLFAHSTRPYRMTTADGVWEFVRYTRS